MRKLTFLLIALVSSLVSLAQSFSFTGSLQKYVVPPCVTQITVTAAGGAGGGSISTKTGGLGAIVTETVNVVPKDTLYIVVGEQGSGGGYGAGGGGGSFVWDSKSTAYPLVVAGGGGGDGGSIILLGLGQNGSTTMFANGGSPYNGTGGLLGQGGAAGTGSSYGGGGAGWNTTIAAPPTITTNFGQGGLGDPSFAGGIGGTFQPAGNGGYGGGGGGGCETSAVLVGGGGGGSGYNGGGGGNSNSSVATEYGGAGGGSGYYTGNSPYNNPANFVSPVTVNATNTSNGYVIITPIPEQLNINSSASCGLGTATANVTGGLSPYTYLWNPGGQTGMTATNLTAGSYTVTVTSASGCVLTASVNIVTPPVLNANASVNANTGECTNIGSASSSPTGGTPGYTYAWSNGGTNATINNLSKGTYNVTVTDANGCTATAAVTITAPPPVTANAIVTANTGECTNVGSATVTANQGVPAYTYLWSNTATTPTINNLSKGTYNVTVTDASGCTATATVIITAPPPVTANTTVPNNATACTNSGSATVTAGPGLPPYTYLWSTGNTTTAISGLSVGTYTITVTDANGCKATATATITVPPPLVANTSLINNTETCINDGSVTVSGSGGTAPYTYVWNPGNIHNQTLTGLSAGTYTATVTDAAGCIATASIVVNTLPVVTANTTVNANTTECTNVGKATAGGSGGVPAYTYSWSSGQTTAHITGLSAGTYVVTVTDANGCQATASVTITEPPPILVNASVIKNSAECIHNGSATSAPSGGVPGYTYSWSNGSTNPSATGLGPGTYIVTVTDADNCQATASVTITAPPPLVGGDTVNSNTTACTTVGSATIRPTGGQPAYTYLWANNGSTNATQTGLSAGSYNCTVTDANGCNVTVTVTITQPPPLTTSTTVNTEAETCGNIGGATANPSGGAPSYTYSWALGGQTTAHITGLSVGTYTVTVTDSQGCTASATANIILLPPVTVNTTVNANATACNATNGSATANPGGGSAGYTYLWNTGGQTNITATGLSAGTYTVTVTDQGGCTATATAVITVPLTLTANAVVNSNSTECINTGSATVSPGGGDIPYTYLWTGGNTNAHATGLAAGSYIVTVTDADGCTATASVLITAPPPLNGDAIINSNTTECTSVGSATMNPTGGLPGYTYLWNDGGTNINETGLSAGSYNTTITDANNCSVTVNFSITAPPALNVNGVVNTNCGTCGNTGSATANVSGGVNTYTYSWSNGKTSSFVSNLSAGSYSVSVTDANNCNTTTSVTILQMTAVTADTLVINYSAACASTGSVSVVPGGGELPYSYQWSNSTTNLNATGLSVGSYSVTVTDLDGCSATSSVAITAPPAVTASAVVNNNTGECTSVGSATVTPGGGNPSYTYSWTGGNTNINATGLSAGSYIVTVTDADGCSATSSVAITAPPVVIVNASVISNSAACASTGSASVSASSGQTPYTYLWSTGSTSTNISALSAGTYNITVTDANNCSVTASVSITAPPTVVPNITVNSNSSSCASTGSATANPTGGATPYTYAWTNGSNLPSVSGLSAGGYTLVVTDANGCTGSASINITQPLALSGVMTTHSTTCGNPNGGASIFVSGGAGAYTYLWSPGGGTSNFITGISAGAYSVIVTDSEGCSVTVTSTVNNKYTFSSYACCDTTIAKGQEANLRVVPANKGDIYTWSPPSNLNCTDCPDPIATPLATTTYSVVVTDTNGCTGENSVTVTVGIPCTDFTVPTVFTPNDDGINDDFVVNAVSTISFNIAIYDRWGKQVFTSNNPSVSWNGRINSTQNLVPDGTYYYVINANCGATDYSKKGFVEVAGEK